MSDSFLCKTSVKDWVEFCCRSGDLIFDSSESGPQGRITALQGQRAHKRVQQQRHAEYGETYQAEFSIKDSVCCEFSPGVSGTLQFQGRIDSVISTDNDNLIIEEIKTVADPHQSLAAEQTALHMAQAKVYAFAYLKLQQRTQAEVRVCYTGYEKNAACEFVSEAVTIDQLEQFVDRIAKYYLHWQWQQQQHQLLRDSALKDLQFPYAGFRPQQRELSESVYKAISLQRPLLSEAPTGSGKTLAHLFPALKAIAQGKVEKIIFVTAKISGQQAALETIELLRKSDTATKTNLRILQIPAKDRSCFCRTEGMDNSICSFTLGYYDRMPAAREELLNTGFADKDTLLTIAREHRLCPFQLVQDCLSWSDVIVADYNYIFDPLVSFNGFLERHAKHSVLLVDEAHNLAERARDMYSAKLSYRDSLELAAQSKSLDKSLHKSAQALAASIKALNKSFENSEETVKDQPDDKIALRVQAIAECFVGGVLTENAFLQEHFRTLIRYQVINDLFDKEHKSIHRTERSRQQTSGNSKSEFTITLFNTDPAAYTAKTMSGFHCVCLFSASLTPLNYHRETLGLAADIATQSLLSPFAPEHLQLIVNTAIDTRYKQRENSYRTIAELLPAIVSSKPGNYFIAFPSYQYLTRVLDYITPLAFPGFNIVTQQDLETPEQREQFLQELRQHTQATLLFAVTGGSFTEAVDLPGEQLLGIVVVGVGLPQLCTERELIKQRFDEAGFDYAYQYPGWTRVLQSVGRVIRTESDRGIAVLIDSRYSQSRYRQLFPPHWQPSYLSTASDTATAIHAFWQAREHDVSNS